MNQYLFLNFLEYEYNLELLDKIKQYEQIHINFCDKNLHLNKMQDCLKTLKQSCKAKELFLYCHSFEQIKLAQSLGIKIHYCYLNDSVLINNEFHQKAQQDKEAEIFWILDNNILSQEIDKFKEVLTNWARPVCPTISGILLNDLNADYESLRQWLKNLHSEFKNPLFQKELSLEVSNWSFNDYMYVQKDKTSCGKLIMGVFGDLLLPQNADIDLINLTTLLKTKDCRGCDYFDYCKHRGIGYIINKLNLNGCISYNLFNQKEE